MSKKLKFLKKKARNNFAYWGASVLFNLAPLVPRFIGLRICGALGVLAFPFTGKEKKRTIEHLEKIFASSWSRREIAITARDVYRNLGMNLFDTIYLSKVSDKKFHSHIESDSLDEFTDAYRKGRGVIIITAHVGCFEMLLQFFARKGFKSFAIGRKMYDQRLENLIRKTRSGNNIEYMHRNENTRRIIRLLNEGRIFGVLIDQDTRVEGVYADFLGYPAFTPSGPLRIAMKMDIPVFLITTARQKDLTHRIYIEELPLSSDPEFDVALKENVTKANSIISSMILRFPSQWVWMHRRWKRKPPVSP